MDVGSLGWATLLVEAAAGAHNLHHPLHEAGQILHPLLVGEERASDGRKMHQAPERVLCAAITIVDSTGAGRPETGGLVLR